LLLVLTLHQLKGTMKYVQNHIFTVIRLLTLVTLCATSSAWADDYADVNQLLQAGRFTEALIKADVYLAGKPRDPQMRFLKGVIQRNAGKQSEAIATFTKLTEDYPELPEPYNNLAVLYAGKSQFDKARTALEMAIRTNPSYATAHENLGDVYARLASQAYGKALQLDAGNAAVQPKLALIGELFKPNLKGPTAAPVAAPTASPLAQTPAVVAQSPVTPTATPARAVVEAPAMSKADASDPASQDVENAVHAWAKAWSAKDVSAYLSAYSKDFKPAGMASHSAWEQERRKRILGKSNITVKLENLTVSVDGNNAVAKFRQDYRAGALVVSSRKSLELHKSGGQWRITQEKTGN
jgi:tetratricopeptide (TPR) repeat protein